MAAPPPMYDVGAMIVRPLGVTVLLVAWNRLPAQTTCITPNCSLAGTPASCLNRAAPRTSSVQMGNVTALVFVPPDPKIEPGDCVIWRAATSAHSSSEAGCAEDSFCGAPPVASCAWDSANVSSGSATPTATCYYEPALFPQTTNDNFYCRIHATPTAGSMRGTLHVTSPIQLTLGKDLGTASVKLSWTGGGVPGDVSYKVARQSGGNPRFPAASTTTVNPDGGVLGIVFTDTGDLANATSRYYLVRNKQSNEP